MAELSIKMDVFAMTSFAVKNGSQHQEEQGPATHYAVDRLDPGSDESLLIAVGNQQSTSAFNELFERFAGKVFAHGMKLTRNEQLSKDLVQEAMLAIWQKAPLYDFDRGSANNWIFTLTRNRCFDLLRKQKRQPNCVNAEDIWPTDSDEIERYEATDREYIGAEIAQVEKFLAQLPAAQKVVVEQIYLLDKTHEEAAALLEIPLGTLKSRLRLAMGKLRQLIGHDND